MSSGATRGQATFRFPLPPQYVEHKSKHAGIATDDGLLIYSAVDLAERNETFEVQQYLPGFLLIGDDSGGRGFFIRLNEEEGREVVMLGLGCLMESYLVVVASSLEEWARAGYAIPE